MVESSFRLFWVANFAPYLDFLFFFSHNQPLVLLISLSKAFLRC